MEKERQIEPVPPAQEKSKAWQKIRNINKKWLAGWSALVVVALAVGLGFWLGQGNSNKQQASSTNAVSAKNSSSLQQTAGAAAQGLQLDANKNYGNKYSSGILPVGDSKYSTTGAKAGYVYVCSNYAKNLASDAGGAGRRGPWFIGTTQYDLNKKISVEGSVNWQSSFSDEVSGSTRTITSNDLPNHPTGIFPISATDPAYAYDKNPNTIQAQSFTYGLSADPTYGSPQCVGGQVGVMLTGVAIFSGFDAGGRDAGAWEIQDSCQGHPQSGGIYHYHTLSSCIKDTSVKTVIGFALDGFPITGPKVGNDNILTTADLDECHGITSQIVLDGKTTTMYHYVMTQDFPYSISCYRAKATQAPGQQEGGAQGGQQTQNQGTPSGNQGPGVGQQMPPPRQ